MGSNDHCVVVFGFDALRTLYDAPLFESSRAVLVAQGTVTHHAALRKVQAVERHAIGKRAEIIYTSTSLVDAFAYDGLQFSVPSMIAAFVTRLGGNVAALQSTDAYYVEGSAPDAPRSAVVQGFPGVGLATEASNVRLYDDDVSETDFLRMNLGHRCLGPVLVARVERVAEMVRLRCVSRVHRGSRMPESHDVFVPGVGALSLLAADADEIIRLLLSGQCSWERRMLANVWNDAGVLTGECGEPSQ